MKKGFLRLAVICFLIAVIACSAAIIAQADPISKEDLTDVATQKEVDIDSVRILPTTETVDVRLETRYLDKNDKVLRKENAGREQKMNRPATETEEAMTGWDDLQPELDAFLNKLRSVL